MENKKDKYAYKSPEFTQEDWELLSEGYYQRGKANDDANDYKLAQELYGGEEYIKTLDLWQRAWWNGKENNFIFNVPFEDVPLYINGKNDIPLFLVEWRLQIGK